MPATTPPPPRRASLPLVRCVRCHTTLRLPPNAPVFQCPQCQQRLRAPPAVVADMQRAATTQRAASAGARVLLGESWSCEICTHKNDMKATACHMCSTTRKSGARMVLEAQDAGDDDGGDAVLVADVADGDTPLEAKTSAASEQASRLQRMGTASRRRESAAKSGNGALRARHVQGRRVSDVHVSWALAPSDDGSPGAFDELRAGFVRDFPGRGAAGSPLEWKPASEGVELAQDDKMPRFGLHDVVQGSDLPFGHKVAWFRGHIGSIKVPYDQGHKVIKVHRERLLRDSFATVMGFSSIDLRKVWRFHFEGEPGRDAGGLAREWFTIASESIFNPDLALFKSHSGVYIVNEISGIANENHLDYFRFFGRLLGKSLLDAQTCAAPLASYIFKHLTAKPVVFDDIEAVDPELYRQLKWLVENEGVEDLDLDFTVMQEVFGSTQVIELKPGGADEEVTDENKLEYVTIPLLTFFVIIIKVLLLIQFRFFFFFFLFCYNFRYVRLKMEHMMLGSCSEQLRALLAGFYDVVPLSLASVLSAKELELLLCGLPTINVDDWRGNAQYRGEYTRSSKNIKWFWQLVESLSNEKKARLLQFTCGTARVPVEGFKGLRSYDGKVHTVRCVYVFLSLSLSLSLCITRQQPLSARGGMVPMQAHPLTRTPLSLSLFLFLFLFLFLSRSLSELPFLRPVD